MCKVIIITNPHILQDMRRDADYYQRIASRYAIRAVDADLHHDLHKVIKYDNLCKLYTDRYRAVMSCIKGR